jgi:hypothetical protein
MLRRLRLLLFHSRVCERCHKYSVIEKGRCIYCELEHRLHSANGYTSCGDKHLHCG